jgi:hypothetical protein
MQLETTAGKIEQIFFSFPFNDYIICLEIHFFGQRSP